MTVSKLALASLLAVGGLATIAVSAAEAQRSVRDNQREQERRRAAEQAKQGQTGQTGQTGQIAQLTREESAAIAPLFEAVRAANWPAATAALPAAQAGAVSPYAKYVVGQLHYEIGRGTASDPIQLEGINAMVASGGAPADQLRPLVGNQIAFALRANNMAGAETALNRFLEIEPNNVTRLQQLAEVKIHLNKRGEAAALFQRAIQLGEAGGQKAAEDIYRRAFALAYEARNAEQTLALGRALVQAYPTPANWRSVTLAFRQQHQSDAPLQLDARRFMRAAGLLREAGEYVGFADSLNRTGQVGEVKAVIDEAIARRVLQAADGDARTLLAAANARIREDQASLPASRTAALAAAAGRPARQIGDAYFGYGQYADAAALYRAALEKGGEDANLVNIRLGASLALAGQRAEAETAFRAVTTGPRAELAQLWLLWLASRPAA